MDTGIDLRIKELCKERGIGVAELADKIGLSRVSVGNFIARRQWPSSDSLKKMAEVLGVEVAELFAAPSSNTFRCPHCGKPIEFLPVGVE